MDITFRTTKLAKQCTGQRTRQKTFGQKQAEKLGRRLDDLRAAKTLDDLRNAPGRCHELTSDRAGQLSIELEQPYRLIFEPSNEPVPKKDDGGLDWSRITAVRILEIVDYH